MQLLSRFLEVAPDWLIIVVYTSLTAAIGLGVAAMARRLFPHRFSQEANAIGETVNSIVLYFAMFLLALVIADARGNLSAASDIVEQEGFQVAHLDRQLRRYGDEPTEKIRTDLIAYVRSVTEGGWKIMGAKRGSTALTRSILDRLTDEIYALTPATELQVALKPSLIDDIDNLERQREFRLEKSNNTTPISFWGITLLFIFMAMVLCGRYHPTKMNRVFIACLMASYGIGLATLAIFDEPFRGQTSVSPVPLLNAAAQIEANLPRHGGPASSGSSSP